jgi:hypothetical protein
MLTLAATYNTANCGTSGERMAVSPDGRYLATEEVQIYSIAANGTLTAALSQPYTFTWGAGIQIPTVDLTWDSSGSYLVAATYLNMGGGFSLGGVAVLQFSGNAVTETAPPTGLAVVRLQRTGSFVYAMGACGKICLANIFGYDLQNGQLTPLPGSPYAYGNGGDMVIY